MSNPDKTFEESSFESKVQVAILSMDSTLSRQAVIEAVIAAHQSDIERIIGDELDEGDGWDWAFGEESQCCPGDDFAYFGNHLRKQMLQRAAINTKEKE